MERPAKYGKQILLSRFSNHPHRAYDLMCSGYWSVLCFFCFAGRLTHAWCSGRGASCNTSCDDKASVRPSAIRILPGSIRTSHNIKTLPVSGLAWTAATCSCAEMRFDPVFLGSTAKQARDLDSCGQSETVVAVSSKQVPDCMACHSPFRGFCFERKRERQALVPCFIPPERCSLQKTD